MILRWHEGVYMYTSLCGYTNVLYFCIIYNHRRDLMRFKGIYYIYANASTWLLSLKMKVWNVKPSFTKIKISIFLSLIILSTSSKWPRRNCPLMSSILIVVCGLTARFADSLATSNILFSSDFVSIKKLLHYQERRPLLWIGRDVYIFFLYFFYISMKKV